MRIAGKLKLGFFPLPVAEAKRLRNYLVFPGRFSALDPCVGDGAAFVTLLEGTNGQRLGIEIDSHRTEQATALGIQVTHASTMDVRATADSFSLLYLNPPYDFETGQNGNQRLERVFLEHTYRWLRPGGVLVFVIPQPQLKTCARLVAEHFSRLSTFRLTDPACLPYKQIVLFGVRRKRHERLKDSELLDSQQYLEALSRQEGLAPLADSADIRYEIPESEPAQLTHTGIPLDEVEDQLPSSAAYRQAARVLLREPSSVRGRPLTPLHGGHVGLLCTAGMLNGIFGEGEDRHIAHWRSVKFTDHWEDEEEDGTRVVHERERFSHELTLVFANGKTEILMHDDKRKLGKPS